MARGSMFGISLLGGAAVRSAFDALSNKMAGSPVTYVVGTNIEYAAYVEFGTSRMAAQPYLRPAVERVGRNLGKMANSANSLAAFVALVAKEVLAEAKRLCPVDTGTLRASIRMAKV